MIPILFFVTLSACETVAKPECGGEAFDEDGMYADVAWLASPSLEGRVPGTAGDEAAREMIAERFACSGLEAFGDAYQQPFTDSEGNETANVLGFLEGESGTVGDEFIVVSAHLDHLGAGRLGANDNASGLTGLLSIAQAIAEGAPVRRSVIFAAFGSEESGFEGSEFFYTSPPDGLDPTQIVYNLNMDMIGTYDQTEVVWALGAMPGTPGRRLLTTLAEDYPELDIGLDEPSDLSDNVSFCTRGIPYVFMWTEDPDCYHEACDKADRLDYESLASIASLTADLTVELADSTEDLLGEIDPEADVCDG